jgi:hypothetical protein
MKSFAASVADWANRTKAAQLSVMRDSVADVIEDAGLPKAQGGRMPVDTGNLRNTVASGLNGEFGPDDSSNIELTINEMEPGDVARFAWTAEYAMRMELGFVGTDALGRTYEQDGNHFVGGAAAKWEQIVAVNAEKHKP